jgi:ATP adenylyltransferase
MDKLWSPWCSTYIDSLSSGKTDEECIFCAAAKQEVDDSENLVVHKSNLTYTLLNLYPYNNGHLMVVPFRHISEFEKLTEEEGTEIFNELQLAQNALIEISHPHGFNVGANLGRIGGAGIEEHIHFHIVPRWNGDTNFMPVLGEVKVISQELMDTKKRLLKAYNKLS